MFQPSKAIFRQLNVIFNDIVECLATGDAVQVGNWFYYNLHKS
jgi:hypothetical protein